MKKFALLSLIALAGFTAFGQGVGYTDTPQPEDVSFDVEGGAFTHSGSLCTFETMIQAFGLADPVLRVIAEIVHVIDLRDGQYAHPEIAGMRCRIGRYRLNKNAGLLINAQARS